MSEAAAAEFLKKGLSRLGLKVPSEVPQAQRLFEVVAKLEVPKGLVSWRLRRFLAYKGLKGSDLQLVVDHYRG